jgi:hypothetical protein
LLAAGERAVPRRSLWRRRAGDLFQAGRELREEFEYGGDTVGDLFLRKVRPTEFEVLADIEFAKDPVQATWSIPCLSMFQVTCTFVGVIIQAAAGDAPEERAPREATQGRMPLCGKAARRFAG